MRPNSGQVWLRDRDITNLPPHLRARLGLVRTFQISRELGELTVLENLLLARQGQTGESVLKAFAQPRQFGVRRRLPQSEPKSCSTGLASGGLQTSVPGRCRVGKKASGVVSCPHARTEAILLDEPAAGVSPPMRAEISEVIRRLCDDGPTFVVVEHDMDMVASLCHRVYVIAEGRNLHVWHIPPGCRRSARC